MAVTQYRAPATVVGSLTGESGLWGGTGNVAASDNSRATYSFKGAGTSSTLRCRSFGFSTTHIPSGAIIVGAELQIERSGTGGGGVTAISDSVVQLAIHSAGSSADRIGTNQASGSLWPVTASEAYATYGGPTSLMGASITDAQARAATLAVDIVAIASNSDTPGIDHVRLRWYYELPSGRSYWFVL